MEFLVDFSSWYFETIFLSFGSRKSFRPFQSIAKLLLSQPAATHHVHEINSQKQTNEYKLWALEAFHTKRFQHHSLPSVVPLKCECYVTNIRLIFKQPFFAHNRKEKIILE